MYNRARIRSVLLCTIPNETGKAGRWCEGKRDNKLLAEPRPAENDGGLTLGYVRAHLVCDMNTYIT